MRNKISKLTDSTFQSQLLKTSEFILVDFWAHWCGPCKILLPILENMLSIYIKKLIIAKLNIDENPISTVKYNIKSIPTLILFKNNEIISTKIGLITQNELEKFLNKFIN